MPYNIDKSLNWDGIYKFTSESGSSYTVKIRESAPSSGLFYIDFIKSNNIESPSKEVFMTMKILSELCKEYVNSKGGSHVVMFISGKPEESLQKSKVFSRWMQDEWNVEIKEPELVIGGKKDPFVYPSSYFISATRKLNKVQNTNQEPLTPVNISNIKFCFNCGTPNNSFVFCPSCGTKLKQA